MARVNSRKLTLIVSASVILGVTGCSTPAQNPTAPFSAPISNGGLASLPWSSTQRGRARSRPRTSPARKGEGGWAIPNPSEPKPAASARAADNLGQGWKVKPFLRVNAGETVTLMDVDGPGVIQHIWMVEGLSRAHVLRFYWDGETTPSVEVPAPDFFAVGHEKFARVNSQAVVVNPANAMNCYWPMPFKRHARVTFTNEAQKDLELLAFQITYALTPVPRADRLLPCPVAPGRYCPAESLRHPGWGQGQGALCRHLPGLDPAPQGLVRRRRDQVLHGRRRPVPHHLRHGNGRLLLRQLRLPGALHDRLHRDDACPPMRTMNRPITGAFTAGTSWTRSASTMT